MKPERIIIMIQLLVIVLFFAYINVPHVNPNVVVQEEVLMSRSIHEDVTQGPQPSYRTDINIWPYPQSYSLTGQTKPYIFLNWRDFKFVGSQNPILQEAFTKYQAWSFYQNDIPSVNDPNGVMRLSVTIQDERETVPHADMDESYVLELEPSRKMFFLSSKSVWGALRGLETFSQLIIVQNNQYLIKEAPVTIKDAPRFKWRGLLMDTSRHFFRVSSMIRTLNAMAFNKMNVLHWHVTDAHSFPLYIPQYPKLTEVGAFRKDAFYSEADVKQIVEHARKLGIRVVMEWDTPAHTHSWGLHYPITAKCPPKWSDINWTPLNPVTNMTYDVIKAIFDTTFKLCPDVYIHLGADEVETECFSLEENIRRFMLERGWSGDDGYDRLQAYFFTRIEPFYRNHKKIPIVWDELLLTQRRYELPKDMVVEAWRSHDIMHRSLALGYKTLLAHGFYLDVQSPSLPRKYRYRWIDTWRDFYENEPFRTFNFTEAQKKNLLGGEAAMWTEQVDDLNLDSRVWPRTSAVAERLWSPQAINDTNGARWRMNFQRCIMVRRGIDGGPSEPDYMGRHCDSTMNRPK
jgi:hexosaminidase